MAASMAARLSLAGKSIRPIDPDNQRYSPASPASRYASSSEDDSDDEVGEQKAGPPTLHRSRPITPLPVSSARALSPLPVTPRLEDAWADASTQRQRDDDDLAADFEAAVAEDRARCGEPMTPIFVASDGEEKQTARSPRRRPERSDTDADDAEAARARGKKRAREDLAPHGSAKQRARAAAERKSIKDKRRRKSESGVVKDLARVLGMHSGCMRLEVLQRALGVLQGRKQASVSVRDRA